MKTVNDLIDESVSHWERMRDGERIDSEEPWATDCALCQQFDPCGDGACCDCPVMLSTKRPGCNGTPHTKASGAWEEHGPDSPEFKTAAQMEIDFLKSLKGPQHQREVNMPTDPVNHPKHYTTHPSGAHRSNRPATYFRERGVATSWILSMQAREVHNLMTAGMFIYEKRVDKWTPAPWKRQKTKTLKS